MNSRIALIVGATMLALAPVLVAGQTAHASTSGPGIACGGSSCIIQLEHEVQLNGDVSKGSDNGGISVTPPCYWTVVGNARIGSETIVGSLADSLDYSTLPAAYQKVYQQAYKMQSENPIPPGEWYMQLSTSPQYNSLCDQVPFEFVTPGKGGAIVPPPVPLTPHDLALLAIAVLNLPGEGDIKTSPSGGKTYSNLPTFIEVLLAGHFHPADESSRPYVEVTAQLAGEGATAWASASNVTLTLKSGSGDVARDCTYLGSAEMKSDPGAVAATTATGGRLDCGVTFREPQQAQVTAQVTWNVCYVTRVAGLYVPPVGGCIKYNVAMNPTTWAIPFNVQEIQAGNG
jgi:hypothetical protein